VRLKCIRGINIAKAYPPTLKTKKRYLKFEIISEKPVKKEDAGKAIKAKVVEMIGTIGAANADFAVFNLNEKTQKGEIKTNNKNVDLIKACLALINIIGSQQVVVNVERTSGTLKSLRK